MHNHLDFGEPKITLHEIMDKNYKTEPRTLRKKMFNNGFNSEYGASGIYNYEKAVKHCWHFKKIRFWLTGKITTIL